MSDAQVVLRGAVAEHLVERAAEQGVTPDELATEAVEVYLAGHRRISFAGIGHGKPGLYARDVDLILQSSGYGQ